MRQWIKVHRKITFLKYFYYVESLDSSEFGCGDWKEAEQIGEFYRSKPPPSLLLVLHLM